MQWSGPQPIVAQGPTRMDDVRAVMDAVASQRAVVGPVRGSSLAGVEPKLRWLLARSGYFERGEVIGTEWSGGPDWGQGQFPICCPVL